MRYTLSNIGTFDSMIRNHSICWTRVGEKDVCLLLIHRGHGLLMEEQLLTLPITRLQLTVQM